jgi:Transposase DDE domain group 1
MQRVVGIALGYEDLNDHDQLRHDPVLATLANKLAASRSDCAPLAAGAHSAARRQRLLPRGPDGVV